MMVREGRTERWDEVDDDRPAVGRCRRARGHRHVPPHRRRALHEPVGGGARRHGRRHRPPLRAAGRGRSRPTAASDPSSRARATASSPPSPGHPTRCWRRSTRSGALQSETWPTASPLKVRMAIHTGETRLRDEGNYVGERDRADGAAAGHRPRGAGAGVVGDARPRGGRAARRRRAPRPRHPPPQGPRSPRARVAAGPSELESEFPPLASLDSRPEQPARLPVDVHRPRSTRSTRSSGSCSTTGSSTSWGPGGAGKTRLAQQVGAELVEAFRDGVWWVDLVEVRTRSCCRPPSAARCRSPRTGGSPGRGRPAAGRDSGRCSSWTTASTWWTRAPRRRPRSSRRCPTCRILATSRAPLNVPGELSWRVPPLGLPPVDGTRSLEARGERDAVRLFVDRAASACERLPPHATRTSADVVAICSQLDGIPLAIELAAARCRVLVAGPAPRRARRLAGRARQRPTDASMSATRPSSARSSGATRCSPTHRAVCSVAWVCSPARSPWRPPSRVVAGRRGRAARGGRRARAPHRPVARADGRPSAPSRASACSRRFASSLAGRSTPPGRPRRSPTATPPTSAARALGLWPLFHDGLAALLDTADAEYGDLVAMLDLPRATTPRPRSTRRWPWPACPPSACGTSPRWSRSARPSPPGWSRPACSAATSTCGSPWPTRRCRSHVQIALAAAEATDDPELGALATYWGTWGQAGPAPSRDAVDDLRAGSHRPRGRWGGPLLPDPLGRRGPPPRDGPPHGGHPALAEIRRGDGVHAVQRHGLVGGDAARPRPG